MMLPPRDMNVVLYGKPNDAVVNESGALMRGLMLSSLPLSPHALSVNTAHIRIAAEPNFINLMGNTLNLTRTKTGRPAATAASQTRGWM
jgi:hypothetical protein